MLGGILMWTWYVVDLQWPSRFLLGAIRSRSASASNLPCCWYYTYTTGHNDLRVVTVGLRRRRDGWVRPDKTMLFFSDGKREVCLSDAVGSRAPSICLAVCLLSDNVTT